MPSALAQRIHQQLQQQRWVNAAALHRKRREISKLLQAAPASVVWELVDELGRSTGTVSRFFACGLLRHHPPAFAKVTASKLEQLGAGMSSWADVDIFATMLAGQAWREGLAPDSAVHRWARSNDIWWRRAALVCTVALNVEAQGGHGDAKRTLGVCKLLVLDRQDMVVKAMSWALRALSVRDPQAVHDFLHMHEAKLAARVLREVRNKLTTGLKTPRRRATPAGGLRR